MAPVTDKAKAVFDAMDFEYASKDFAKGHGRDTGFCYARNYKHSNVIWVRQEEINRGYSDLRYVCTRPKGHDGMHVAHTSDEPLLAWTNDDKEYD